jgi:gliding motility-associated-like protein
LSFDLHLRLYCTKSKEMRILFTALVCVFIGQINAQITATYVTPEEAVAALVGEGILVENITFTGSTVQLGEMSGGDGTIVPINEGIILSSADVFNIDPILGTGGDVPFGEGISGDADLLTIANSVPPLIGQSFTVGSVNDISVLEFDFVPSGDSLNFSYIFGSNEYLTYVNTTYNDVFAFFLSGPGLVGPYDAPAGFPDGAVNIAFVPDSDPILPITISSVNNVLNQEYYVDNPSGTDIQQNGFTLKFTAEAQVICGETYHIKLGIGDGSDTALESIVILESGSFASNAVSISSGVDNPPTFLSSNQVYEGCVDGYFTIYPPLNLLEPDTIELNVSGTAENIIDIEEVPEYVIFQPGQGPFQIPIIPLYDQITEGTETLTLNYTYLNTCGDLDTASASIEIVDYIDMELTLEDLFICPDASAIQNASPSNGQGDFNYAWSSGGDSSSETYNSGDEGPYNVVVTDFCDRSISEDFSVTEPDPIVWTDPIEQYCVGQTTADMVAGGAEPYDFIFNTDSLVIGTSGGQFWEAIYPGVYPVVITDQCDQSNVFIFNYVVCNTVIPNVFTPGTSSGANDAFKIDGILGFPNSTLSIFNRWGGLIYESENYQNQWDATGESAGTYYYIFERSDGESFSGHVTVIRGKDQ